MYINTGNVNWIDRSVHILGSDLLEISCLFHLILLFNSNLNWVVVSVVLGQFWLASVSL